MTLNSLRSSVNVFWHLVRYAHKLIFWGSLPPPNPARVFPTRMVSGKTEQSRLSWKRSTGWGSRWLYKNGALKIAESFHFTSWGFFQSTLSRKSHLKYQLYLMRKANAFVLRSYTHLDFVVWVACNIEPLPEAMCKRASPIFKMFEDSFLHSMKRGLPWNTRQLLTPTQSPLPVTQTVWPWMGMVSLSSSLFERPFLPIVVINLAAITSIGVSKANESVLRKLRHF